MAGKTVFALNHITLGVGSERRQIAPGTQVQLTQEQYDELISHDPPCIQDPRARDREMRMQSEEGREMVAQVAEPEKADPQQEMPTATEGRSARTDTGKISRQAPEGAKADKDEL